MGGIVTNRQATTGRRRGAQRIIEGDPPDQWKGEQFSGTVNPGDPDRRLRGDASPGKEGMIHISQLPPKPRVEKVET